MNVTIYTTPNCHYCKLAKDYLEENNVPVVSIDITADKEVEEHVKKLTGATSVPVIVIGNNILIGFNKPRLKELLNLEPTNWS